ncbi:TonB-dependent siderophore receptor [Caballeronia sordidicola]|uniref:TonB-dependent siderophore receptor n=1 Tax=Caballeronia sordidicola TaxID=196367 RepID=A0A158GDW4_CABSO|nr:TonB-dependent siderophore receptor [Caballeronia sordidicola]SAL30314.1 TonB-dependent siderophore receptor [Caballeronia sordidicola]
MKFAAPRRRRDCAAGTKKFELLRAFSAATVLVSTAWPIASNAATDLPADPVPPSKTAAATSTDTGTGTDTAHDGVVSGGTLKAVTVTGSNLQRASTYAPKTVSTGQYRGLDALDVPATVNVVTRDVLTAQAATGIYDALRNVAGVVRQQLSGIAYDQLSIRGIALDNRTSYYLNGVLPIDNNIWMPMEDKDRVEVLKGASALYYGFAVPAGIVNMVTKRAGNTPVTSASLLVDSNGSVGAHADVARRFGTDNQFGIRVNAMDEHLETPITGDRGYRKFESVALDWRANDRLSFKYDLEHIDERVVEQAGITPLAAVNGVIALPRLPDASTLLVPNDKKTNATATSQLLRADYLISENWSANVSVGQSITQRDRWLWILQKYNVNTGNGSLQGSKQNGQFYESKVARAEVNGLFQTGNINHDVTFGVSETWQFQPDFTTYYYTATQNLYSPVSITQLTAAGSKAFYAQHINNRGAYVFDRIDLTSTLQFTPGLRYSDYHATQAFTTTQDVNRTSPSASLVYKITPQTSVYASYIEGLESAGSAPATASNAYQVLPAAVSKQEELGVRHRFSNDSLASIALFQIRQPAASTDANNVYALNGTGRYRGLEFSYQGDVTRDLSIVTTGMWLNSRLVDSSDPSTLGKIPENTPRYTGSIFLNYRVPHVAGFSLNGGAYFVGSRPINDANQATIPGYTLFSAGARYATRMFGKAATFQLNVENAFNKHYWASAGSSQLGIGLERTVSLTSTFDF